MKRLRELIARFLLDTLRMVPAEDVGELSELIRDLDACGVSGSERLAFAKGLSVSAQLGLKADEIEPALAIGARFLAHGFTGPEIDRMVTEHYKRAALHQR